MRHWKERKYKIQCRNYKGEYAMVEIPGYVRYITDDLSVGITQHIPFYLNGKWSTKYGGMWTLSILPEGIAFKAFRRKCDASDFLNKEADNFVNYIREGRKERNGSINNQNEG